MLSPAYLCRGLCPHSIRLLAFHTLQLHLPCVFYAWAQTIYLPASYWFLSNKSADPHASLFIYCQIQFIRIWFVGNICCWSIISRFWACFRWFYMDHPFTCSNYEGIGHGSIGITCYLLISDAKFLVFGISPSSPTHKSWPWIELCAISSASSPPLFLATLGLGA